MDATAIEQEVAPPTPARSRRKIAATSTAPAPGARRGRLPQAQAPQLYALLDEPPEGPGWISEIKFDGYRLLAALEDGRVRLLTRNGLDRAARLPALPRGYWRRKILREEWARIYASRDPRRLGTEVALSRHRGCRRPDRNGADVSDRAASLGRE